MNPLITITLTMAELEMLRSAVTFETGYLMGDPEASETVAGYKELGRKLRKTQQALKEQQHGKTNVRRTTKASR